MRTNSDALRMVAESHVDLAKTIAAVKGLPRNASVVPPPAEPESTDDDDDDDEQEERPRHWVELIMPLAEKAAELVPALVMGKVMQQPGANDQNVQREPSDASSYGDLASKPNWELRDLYNLNYAAAKAAAKKAAKQGAATGASASEVPKPSLQARVMADPKLVSQFVAIKALLSADEGARLLELGQRLSEQQQEWLLAQIRAVSPDEAASQLRGLLVELNEAKPST
jgi:hypothetical protein